MIAQVKPRHQETTDDRQYVIGTVKYRAGSGKPSKFNPDQIVANIVVDTADCEIRVWGDYALLRTLHKGNPVILEKSDRAKNWKVSQDASGKVRTSAEEIPSYTPIHGVPQTRSVPSASPQAIAAEIGGLAGLYAQCFSATQKALAGTGAPAETVQAAASSLFIQLNKNHSVDTLLGYQGAIAKADLGF